MTSYVNPIIVPIPFPVGVDSVIEALRLKIAELPWLEKVFARAIEQHSPGDNNTDVIYPEVWGSNMEPMNVMMNDNLRAYAFFVARDPQTAVQYVNAFPSQIILQEPVSCIVWGNLRKIDSTKDYRFSERLKIDLITQLSKVPAFTLTQIYESYKRVFEGFTLTDTFRAYLKPPFWAIRIDCNLSYPLFSENCEAVNYLLSDEGSILRADDGTPLLAD